MKIVFTTNKTSRNGFRTGRTGATAPTQNLTCNKTQTLNIAETQTQQQGKFDPHATNTSSHTSQMKPEIKQVQRQHYIGIQHYKTTTTTTSQRDCKVCENPNFQVALKGLKLLGCIETKETSCTVSPNNLEISTSSGLSPTFRYNQGN